MSAVNSIAKVCRAVAVYGAALSVALWMSTTVFAGGHGAPAPSHDHGAPAASHGHGDAHEAAAAVDYSGLKTRGIELGDFRIRAYYPVAAQKSTVRFVLYAAVDSDHYEEIQHLVDQHRHLLRDQIITATRLAPLSLFDEPDLKSFRRRIFMRLRRALPELTVDDVYVTEFQLTVKSL